MFYLNLNIAKLKEMIQIDETPNNRNHLSESLYLPKSELLF